MGLAGAADSIHEVAFDLEIPESREVQAHGNDLIENVVPTRPGDRRRRIDQPNVVMAVVASNFDSLRKTIGAGNEPGWLIRSGPQHHRAAWDLGGNVGTARLIAVFGLGVKVAQSVFTVVR